MIAISLPSTPTRDVREAGNKRYSNSLVTDNKLIDNVDLLEKQGINR